ncbi:hypothetical protein, partial [Yersinia enterocolitica]|uniref:hypothetical protein n=1 Tax=Yersinia enterocolitica TaxID=630 RepID=UPI000B1E0F2F
TLALDLNLSIKRQINLGVLYLYYASKGGGYQLMVNDKVFNLFCHKSRDGYIYSVYNTEGWEYSFSANN